MTTPERSTSSSAFPLELPPIVFGTASLGNAKRVITEQAKIAICGEWFRSATKPIWVNADYRFGDGMALEVLGRILRRLDVDADEVVIELKIDGGEPATASGNSAFATAQTYWEKSCRLLSDAYQPKLISVDAADTNAWQFASDLKSEGQVQCVGVHVSSCRALAQCLSNDPPAWITLSSDCTVMRHSHEMLALLSEVSRRQIPLIATNVLESGFLVGGAGLDGRTLSSENPADRALFAWRKAFVALCDGHGISPAHACIQFALSLPGVAAVLIDSSYADRVAANIYAAHTKVPENLWASMREEGLLASDVLRADI